MKMNFKREEWIKEMIRKDLNNYNISKSLNNRKKTVDQHLSSILEKN